MSNIHEWTIEEDDYLLLAHNNGIPMTRMANRLGVHRETIKRRLNYLLKVYGEEPLLDNKDRSYRNKMERLENRKPPPFALWANAMINLSKRANNGNYSE